MSWKVPRTSIYASQQFPIMTRPKPNPTNWDDYQYGTSPHRSSVSSAGGRSVQFENQGESPRGEGVGAGHLDVGGENGNSGLRRRR